MTHGKPGCLTFGHAQYSSEIMRETTSSSTGHLAMPQTSTNVLPRPMTSPALLASGPVKTTASAVTVSRISSDDGDAEPRPGSSSRSAGPRARPRRVGRVHERADVARGRPDRRRQADDQRDRRAALVGLAGSSDVGEDVLGRAARRVLRLSSSGCVADGPITPSTETSASSIGNSDSTPSRSAPRPRSSAGPRRTA